MLDKLQVYHQNANEVWKYIHTRYQWMAVYKDAIHLFENEPYAIETGWSAKGVSSSNVVVFDVPDGVADEWRLTAYPRTRNNQSNLRHIEYMRQLFPLFDNEVKYLAVNSNGSLVAIVNLDGIFPSVTNWARTSNLGLMTSIPHVTVSLPEGMSWRQSLVQR